MLFIELLKVQQLLNFSNLTEIYYDNSLFLSKDSTMRRVLVYQTDGDVFTADVPPNIVNIKEDGVTDNAEVEPSQ